MRSEERTAHQSVGVIPGFNNYCYSSRGAEQTSLAIFWDLVKFEMQRVQTEHELDTYVFDIFAAEL